LILEIARHSLQTGGRARSEVERPVSRQAGEPCGPLAITRPLKTR